MVWNVASAPFPSLKKLPSSNWTSALAPGLTQISAPSRRGRFQPASDQSTSSPGRHETLPSIRAIRAIRTGPSEVVSSTGGGSGAAGADVWSSPAVIMTIFSASFHFTSAPIASLTNRMGTSVEPPTISAGTSSLTP